MIPTPLRKISPLVYLGGQGTEPLPSNALRLAVRPTKAFGDGSHHTTRLCAGAVDLLCRLYQPQGFLDVGTGTGILARIARARGVSRVAGTDIDPHALQSAREHCALDPSNIQIMLTSGMPDQWGPDFALVVANILEQPLRALAPNLVGAIATPGDLLLSGFTPAQSPALRVAFECLGLKVNAEAALDGWALLHLRKESRAYF